jgi:thiol-disulfide isomerase/thioredoxin
MINNVDNLEQLKYIIEKEPRVVVLDFYANWCTPCVLLTPLLIDMEKYYKNKCLVIQIDVERYFKIADAFNITAMPTIMFFYNNTFWKELTLTGAEIGTIYENVNILLTMHNDGEPKLKKDIRNNPKVSLDSYDYNKNNS